MRLTCGNGPKGSAERVADAKPGDVRVLATAAIRIPLDAIRAVASKTIGRPLARSRHCHDGCAIGLRGDGTPDLSTPDTIKTAMLNATSLRWADTGAALFTVNTILDTLRSATP